MKTISTQKNGIGGLRKAMEGGIELLRYTEACDKRDKGSRYYHTHKKYMKHGRRGLETVMYTVNEV